ncbi:MAG: type II toxin-antitoxin system RelE/ParE family toxin [Deltaproteobacteria bacterium]|nr:type II toxin-antitoxin system RelE/ParE family toxin [Deltaproteobacteria bacterium]MDQ3297679.1 type II toxin-antitoxin system RelE/ParE family toxin [Myxococcota bacterium]
MAAEWYEARRQDLGIDFVTAVREALLRVAEAPQTWPLVRDVPEQLNVRRFLLRRFPYSVVFIELDAEIRVLAIAHTSREPGFWRARL